jgi:hypothetical protein
VKPSPQKLAVPTTSILLEIPADVHCVRIPTGEAKYGTNAVILSSITISGFIIVSPKRGRGILTSSRLCFRRRWRDVAGSWRSGLVCGKSIGLADFSGLEQRVGHRALEERTKTQKLLEKRWRMAFGLKISSKAGTPFF